MVSLFFLINSFFDAIFTGLALLYRPVHFSQSVVIGFFLGVFDSKDLRRIGERVYRKRALYLSDRHNKGPLFDWERRALDNHFRQAKSILITAVGGGREAYNLYHLGYEVHAYECNDRLRDYGNALFEREGLPLQIGAVARDAFPQTNLTYDGIIIGWGAYTHIRTSENRILHLKEAWNLLNPGGVILLSFWSFRFRYLNLYRIQRVGNWTVKMTGRQPVELGDVILPEFCHYFREEQIKAELNAAGFDLLHYDEQAYGHAVARKRNEPSSLA